MKSNPVVHFEMPYKDNERVMNFYSKTFGWEMKNLGAEMGDYVLAGTTETDENRMIKTPGNINGGFYRPDPDNPPIPSVVISVDNLDESIAKVLSNRGKILGNPMDIPGIGRYVAFTDTEGNRVGMIQPPANK